MKLSSVVKVFEEFGEVKLLDDGARVQVGYYMFGAVTNDDNDDILYLFREKNDGVIDWAQYINTLDEMRCLMAEEIATE